MYNEALTEGVVDDATYQVHACEEVHYRCQRGQSSWRYELVCTECGSPTA